MPPDKRDPRLNVAFKLIAALSVLCIALTAAVTILLRRNTKESNVTTPILRNPSQWAEFVHNRYPHVDFRTIYPNRTLEEISAMQAATFGIRYGYAPFIQFRPLPLKSQYVNISPIGYRANKTMPPWPLDTNRYNIFVFGGSTTFGYGVPDAETVVSFLEQNLNDPYSNRFACYNFGAGYYFSSQERLLFEQLLIEGYRPDMAIFIDGLNDFGKADGQPELTPKLHEFVTPDIPYVSPHFVTNVAGLQKSIVMALDRYQSNLQAIRNAAMPDGIATLFVAQPVPFFQFTPTSEQYPFGAPPMPFIACAKGYPVFAERFREGAFSSNFLWAGDTFAHVKEAVYCDAVHYNTAGNKLLAQRIANATRSHSAMRKREAIVPR